MAKEKHLTIRELTLGGLFAALIGAGAFIKITIPVEPTPMHVTLQWFFVLLAGLLLDIRGCTRAGNIPVRCMIF